MLHYLINRRFFSLITIETGEIIKQYETDYPFPSCLINGEELHVVCSINEFNLYIITAYRPSPEKWDAGGKIRKEDKK